MSNYESDERKLEQIKNGKSTFLKSVYAEYREGCLAFLQKYFSCSEENAVEVYQEAFTIFYYNIKDGKLKPPLRAKLETYLNGVAKNIYHKKFLGTYQEKMSFPDEWKEVMSEVDILNRYELDDQKNIVAQLLVKLKDTCQELLRLMYFDNIAAREVATRMGFNSPAAVRKHKHDCLNKMREYLQKKPKV